jgi:hypothetical protein
VGNGKHANKEVHLHKGFVDRLPLSGRGISNARYFSLNVGITFFDSTRRQFREYFVILLG